VGSPVPTPRCSVRLTALAVVLGTVAGGAIALWRSADDAREQAVAAQGEAEAAKRSEEAHRKRAEAATTTEAAARRVAVFEKAMRDTDLAYREYAGGNPALARQLLAGCPPDYRPWEWRLIDRLCRRGVAVVEPSEFPMIAVGFAVGGTLLTVANQTAERWDLAVRKSTVVQRSVTEMAVSADGKRVATVGLGESAVYDCATWEPVITFPNSFKIALDTTGSKLLHSDDQGVTLRDLNTRAATQFLVKEFAASCIALSGDGTRAAVGGVRPSGEGVVKVFSADGLSKPELVTVNPFASVRALAFDPTGARLAAGCDDGAVVVYSLETRTLIRLPGHTAAVEAITFDPTGGWLATGSADRTLRVWSMADGTERFTFVGHAAAVESVAWSREGRIASAGHDGAVWLWETAGRPESVRLAELRPQNRDAMGPSCVLAVSDDGGTLAFGDNGLVQAFDARTGIRLWPRESAAPAPIVSLRVDNARHRVASVSRDGSLSEWDAATGARVGTGTVLPVRDIMHASADGSRALAIPRAFRHTVLNLRNNDAVAITGEHRVAVLRGVLSPNGRFVLTMGLGDRSVLWDATTGAKMCELVGHATKVSSGAFSPDGSRVATCEQDGAVKLWEVSSGRELLTLWGVPRGAVAVAWSEDGSKLVALDDRGTAHVWAAGPPVSANH
jgi:WD40 repeat protein